VGGGVGGGGGGGGGGRAPPPPQSSGSYTVATCVPIWQIGTQKLEDVHNCASSQH
jgi:hypothetical protein